MTNIKNTARNKRGVVVIVTVIFLIILLVRLRAQSIPFMVLSPTEGQNVIAGGTVQLTLSPVAGLSVTGIQVWSPIGKYIQDTGAPLTLTVPSDQLGPVTLLVVGQMSDGSQGSVNRTVNIITTQTLNSISISPNIVRLVAPGTVNGLATTHLTLTGNYADGVARDVSRLPQATIVSDNPNVATVDATGIVTAVAPGQASISVTIGSIIGNARVQVNVFELPGDLDGDGDVDQDDLNIILKALNTKVTGPGDPRDLNNDGKIDALDSRLLVNLCSRPRCATQ